MVLTIARSSGSCPGVHPRPHLCKSPSPRLLRDLQRLGEVTVAGHPPPKSGLADTEKIAHGPGTQQLIVRRTDRSGVHLFVQRKRPIDVRTPDRPINKKTRTRRALSWLCVCQAHYINSLLGSRNDDARRDHSRRAAENLGRAYPSGGSLLVFMRGLSVPLCCFENITTLVKPKSTD